MPADDASRRNGHSNRFAALVDVKSCSSGITIYAGKATRHVDHALVVLLSVPFLAYGIGSLISGMFVYKRKTLDYSNRFDVVREMLDAQRVMELPSANTFSRSITEHTTSEMKEPLPRRSEGGPN